MACSPDHPTMAAVGAYSGAAALYALDSQELLFLLQGHKGGITQVGMPNHLALKHYVWLSLCIATVHPVPAVPAPMWGFAETHVLLMILCPAFQYKEYKVKGLCEMNSTLL